MHDIPVYTDWEMESLRQAFSEEPNMFFILTNSRSFSKEETKMYMRRLQDGCPVYLENATKSSF